ncbi:MAG: hypothetical protein IJN54_03100 [Lachnospiraceae bacterium]|nr:hypothetical protein [Lachnospiraceae bacterium]
MMGLGRERRLNCRLYVDRQADATVVEKLDRLLVEKHFLNQTELIKHGIELVYREVYERAEAIAGELKPELRLLLEGTEARLLEKIANEKVHPKVAVSEAVAEGSDVNESGATAIVTAKQSEEKTEKIPEAPAEKILSTQAINFLKVLNDD